MTLSRGADSKGGQRIVNDTDEVLRDIRRERIAQDEQWGGAPYDDDHDDLTWVAIITKHVGRLADLNVGPAVTGISDRQLYEQIVKVAAVATAYAEAVSRR